jgi:hypothetical protein
VSLGRYSILVVGIVVVTLGVAWPLAIRRLDASARWAAAAGVTLAVLNTMAAHALVLWSAQRSTTTFLRAVLGGMVGRMALMLGAVAAGVLLLGLPRLPFAISLLSYFILFLIVEISILHRHTDAPLGAAR